MRYQVGSHRSASPSRYWTHHHFQLVLLNSTNKPKLRATAGEARPCQKIVQKTLVKKVQLQRTAIFLACVQPEPLQDNQPHPIDPFCLQIETKIKYCHRKQLSLLENDDKVTVEISAGGTFQPHRLCLWTPPATGSPSKDSDIQEPPFQAVTCRCLR